MRDWIEDECIPYRVDTSDKVDREISEYESHRFIVSKVEIRRQFDAECGIFFVFAYLFEDCSRVSEVITDLSFTYYIGTGEIDLECRTGSSLFECSDDSWEVLRLHPDDTRDDGFSILFFQYMREFDVFLISQIGQSHRVDRSSFECLIPR
jgi:hypothetical protein